MAPSRPTHVPDDLPFALPEYLDRHRRVRAAMAERGIGTLVVTSPVNLYYLTGYVASWYPPRLPVALVLRHDVPDLVVADWSRHRDYVPLTTIHDELVLMEYGAAPVELATALADRDWLGSTVALEWHGPTPTAAVMVALGEQLRERGAEVVAADWLVDDLRLVQSDAELAKTRRAAALLDDAFEALATELRPGLTELEVAGRITALLAERGSEVPAQHALVSSGPTAWADVHAFPSRRVIEAGEIVSVDASAVVDRYHVNLSRTFALGRWDPLAADCLDAGRESLAVLCSQARPGADPAPALAAAEAALRERVAPEKIWWVGGYSFGIAFPPSWVGHGYLANDGPTDVVLAPGYVSNFETIMFDREAGFEAAAIDTVAMTPEGLAPLSTLDRGLWLVP